MRATLRPASAALAPLSAERDALPDGRLVHGLTLTYKLDVKEAGKHTMRLPLLNGCAAALPRARQQLRCAAEWQPLMSASGTLPGLLHGLASIVSLFTLMVLCDFACLNNLENVRSMRMLLA